VTALLHAMLVFATVGVFSFGGGFAAIALLQEEVVRQGWLTVDRFVDFIAVSQSTPGAVGVNVASFVGFTLHGALGAAAVTAALVLPGVTLCILFARFLFRFYHHRISRALFRGLRPAVAGVIAAAVWRIGRVAVADWRGMLIAVLCAAWLLRFRPHPLWVILASAAAGLLLQG